MCYIFYNLTKQYIYLSILELCATPNIVQIIGTILVVLSLLAHDIYAQSCGPNTGSQWTTSSGGFTAASSCLCQMEYVIWQWPSCYSSHSLSKSPLQFPGHCQEIAFSSSPSSSMETLARGTTMTTSNTPMSLAHHRIRWPSNWHSMRIK